MVVGHYDGPADYKGPHVLFYAHYDVQPVDPLELWHSPPFEPQLVDGPRGKRYVARGAVDDKGQSVMFLEALRAWHTAGGGIPARITVLIEGEEEVGSVNLEPFVAAHKDDLASDIALISDTGMWDVDTPAVTTRLRGMNYTEVTLKAANRDLHSGLFGGSALNPINALTRILGELKDADGRIQLPGFYDRVKPISNAQRAQWDALGFNEKAFLGSIGLSVPAGERGFSALERLWARPTADINGIWGGYTGEGSKTVIAAEASAKVSFRLVPGQDPAEVLEQFKRFVTERLPADAHVEFKSLSGAPAFEVEFEIAVGARGAGGVAGRIWQRAGADGQRWFGAGGDVAAQGAGNRHAADGVRPGRRPGAQPEREVRTTLLPARHPLACAAAGEVRRGIGGSRHCHSS